MTDLAPLDFSDFREWVRKIVGSVNQALNGANRTTGEVTLTANDTTTTVNTPYVTPDSHITLTPLTANAQADFIAGMRISARTNGESFTITHPNDGDTDKTFSWSLTNP